MRCYHQRGTTCFRITKKDKTTKHKIKNPLLKSLKCPSYVKYSIYYAGCSPGTTDSIRLVRDHGTLNVTEVTSSLGSENAKVTYQVIGPKWHGGSCNEDNLLYQTVTNCLKKAMMDRCESIAIPALCKDFPLKRAMGINVNATRDFLKQHSNMSLKEIHLVDKRKASAFAYAAKVSYLLEHRQELDHDIKSCYTKEGIQINLKSGSIAIVQVGKI